MTFQPASQHPNQPQALHKSSRAEQPTSHSIKPKKSHHHGSSTAGASSKGHHTTSKNSSITPLKNSHHHPLSTKQEFMEKFNRLISYDYQDQLINVEQSLNEIRHTIMKHNIQQQSQRRVRDLGINSEHLDSALKNSKEQSSASGHQANSQKSTLKRTTNHAVDQPGAANSSSQQTSSGLTGVQVSSRLFNNQTNSKFSTISSYRQKRVSFMINADLENDLQPFGQNSRLSSVVVDGIQEENSVSGTGDTRTAAAPANKLD